MAKATIITFPQLRTVVDNLKKKYPTALEQVEADRILYLKSDKEPKKGAKVAKITPIKVPHTSITPLRFALTVFPAYDEVDEARQVIHVLRELLRIEEFEKSKLGGYELQDFPVIVEKYGTTWEEKDDLENPLKEKKPGE